LNPLWKSDAAPVPWAVPTSFSFGFPQAGDLATNAHPTHIGGAWFEAMAEEMQAVIEAAGLTFDPTDITQLYRAIVILFEPT
jgi:hypothetical protein